MIKKSQEGLAMVIVIWVLSLLTIMAGSFSLTMRRETVAIGANKDNSEALAIAESGIVIAQKMMLSKDNSLRWLTNGSIYQFQYQERDIRVRILAENGKIDINKANETSLMTLISSVVEEEEMRQEVVSAILDWRDSDDLVHINGAEKQQYEDAGLTYTPANKAFQTIEELQMVLGLSSEVYENIEPLVTVYSGKASLDTKQASAEVLQMLGQAGLGAELSESSAERVEDEERTESNVLPEENEDDFNSGDMMQNLGNTAKSVYTVISEVKFFEDFETAVKVVMAKNTGDREAPFNVLSYQVYHDISLFSDDMEQFLVETQNESE